MNEEGHRFDSGFDDKESFPVSPVPGGVSLESALRDFGPAAIDDLIVRLRALARLLDRAHARGAVHGTLHPSNVIITDTATSLVAGAAPRAPYAAPEVLRGETATPAADQFGLAAITFEWLFARPVQGPAVRPVEVRTMPGVDRGALSKAFTIALAPEAGERFASCNAFVDAVSAAVIPELPLLAATEEATVEEVEIEDDDPVGPFVPESVPESDPPIEHRLSTDGDAVRANADVFSRDSDVDALQPLDAAAAPPFTGVDDVNIVGSEPNLPAARLDLDDIEPPMAAVAETHPDPVPAWNPTPVISTSGESTGFGGMALILAALVGGIFGFAGGYMARPRALQTGQAQTIVTPPAATESAKPPSPSSDVAAKAPADSTPVSPAPKTAPGTPAPARPSAAPAATAPTPAAPAAAAIGSLLVRSTPSGASVSVDGAGKGVTPLALRDLPAGTRTITITHPGYIAETRKVQITDARPSRSLEVRLSADAPTPAPRPSTPATLGKPATPSKPAATTGTLVVESRPTGASVSVNGRDRGTTPLVIDDLSPGTYQVVLSMTGYRNFATTARVVAGERVRAAASLTVVEQE